ncbi:hypothetical protein V5799_026593 [Amblyomma americanum]|uniref:ubiquitinyl hydrolase 1 n=1 Tax=Amblyomma americanum TaxID=6943 RepID=A0AAQ4DI51_AMBAM
MLSQLHRKLTFASAGSGSMGSSLPPGLVNRGQNLCFAISSLQCLFRTPEMDGLMQEWVQNSNLVMGSNEEAFLWSYLNLHVECVARNLQPATQDNFVRLCRHFMPQLMSTSSSTQEQQDAAEFVMTLLNVLHKILNSRRQRNKPGQQANGSGSGEFNAEFFQVSISTMNKRILDRILLVAYKGWQSYERGNDSPIVHLFTGQTSDIHQCTSCLKTSIRTQEYNVLPITIDQRGRAGSEGKDVMRLYDLLVSFTEAKRMDSRDTSSENELQPGPICNMAAHTSWLHRTMISQTPSAVVLQLLRFQYDSATGQTHKIRDPIQIPSINMCLPNGSGTWPQYRLYGIVAHIGTRSTQDGHYIAYAAENHLRGEKWYKFDDELVTLVDDMEEELTKPFLLENAYLLFYKKT